MKKILLTLLAAVMTLSVSAQGIEIYNGSNLEASYTGSTYKAVLKKTPTELPIPVTAITINGTANMVKGTSGTFTATVTPANATNKAVSWNSANTDVATVDATTGKVTVKSGATAGKTAIIVAAANDGSGVLGKFTVTVQESAIAVTGIALNRSVIGMRSNGSTYQLTATMAPADATNTGVTWTSSDTNSKVTVDANGLVTVAEGATSGESYTITAISKDNSSYSATCKIVVDYVDFGTAGKWSVCNLGANCDIEFGKYYAWGETRAVGEVCDEYPTEASEDWTVGSVNPGYTPGSVKTECTWANYKWGTANNTDAQLKYKDADHVVLENKDDAAYVNTNGVWHMPTYDEFIKLYGSGDYSSTTLPLTFTGGEGGQLAYTSDYDGTGVCGGIIYKKKESGDYSLSDPHIFLPATGIYKGKFTDYTTGTYGSVMYRLNRLGLGTPNFTWATNTSADVLHMEKHGTSFYMYLPGDMARYIGYPIRPVLTENN